MYLLQFTYDNKETGLHFPDEPFNTIKEAEAEYERGKNEPEEDYITKIEIVEIKPVRTLYTMPN